MKAVAMLVVLGLATVSWATMFHPQGHWDSEEFGWGPVNSELVYYPNGWNAVSADLDGDGLHGGLSANGWEQRIWVKQISSPGMSDLTLTARGFGHPSHGASFGVGLSLDGVNWDYVQTRSAAWSAYPATAASVSPGFDEAYQDIDTVFIRIVWQNGNNTLAQPWYTSYITDVQLMAGQTSIYLNDFGTEAQRSLIPEPVTMTLLALGGLMTLRRRRC